MNQQSRLKDENKLRREGQRSTQDMKIQARSTSITHWPRIKLSLTLIEAQASRSSRLKSRSPVTKNRLCHPYAHLSLIEHYVKFFTRLGFQNYCTYHCIYVKNLMLNTHCHPITSTHFNSFTLSCGISLNQEYINVEFDVMYFQ